MAHQRTVKYWRGSELLTREDFETIEQSSSITFGDANHTLVTVKRIVAEFDKRPIGLAMIDDNDLIDLES